jgi:hypothetical protein
MKVSAPHGTTTQRAKEIIVEELPRLLQRFGGQVSNPRYSWSGDTLEFSFRAAGADLNGLLHVNERDVEIEVGIPLRFRLFQGTIESEMRAWCDHVFMQGKSSS